eukprot:341875-Prorocentrum_lima.AAC.1
MTSSLVGSEMCIRDSGRRAHRTVVFVDCSADPQVILGCFRCSPKRFAVSYTHLTLPTICSV